MAMLPVLSLNTQLEDRILWYDGDSTVDSTKISNLLARGKSPVGLWVDSISEDIKQYNQLVPTEEQITVKENIAKPNTEWVLPEEYQKMDPWDYVVNTYAEKRQYDTEDNHIRGTRLASELILYKELGLLDVLRALIYIINTLEKNNVVWGVGRGSSVSSYVLYIIGVHDVDSVKYDLDISDFLRIE